MPSSNAASGPSTATRPIKTRRRQRDRPAGSPPPSAESSSRLTAFAAASSPVPSPGRASSLGAIGGYSGTTRWLIRMARRLTGLKRREIILDSDQLVDQKLLRRLRNPRQSLIAGF